MLPPLSSSRRRILVLGLCCPAVALSSSSSRVFARPFFHSGHQPARAAHTSPSTKGRLVTRPLLGRLRGGATTTDEEDEIVVIQQSIGAAAAAASSAAAQNERVAPPPNTHNKESETYPTTTTHKLATMSPMLTSVASMFQALGKAYGTCLNSKPILTKSVTASIIFGLSDWTAQKIEGSNNADKKGTDEDKTKTTVIDWTRIITASLVGLLYFGPAAHAWYTTIFKILPGTSLTSTLQKATLGQLLFGPTFTCVFFATSLMQSGTFTLSRWITKIRTDLPGAWVAGLGFWPLVDLFSYSLIPSQWIPLFVNFCSFVWTIYLSIVANRKSGAGAASSA